MIVVAFCALIATLIVQQDHTAHRLAQYRRALEIAHYRLGRGGFGSGHAISLSSSVEASGDRVLIAAAAEVRAEIESRTFVWGVQFIDPKTKIVLYTKWYKDQLVQPPLWIETRYLITKIIQPPLPPGDYLVWVELRFVPTETDLKRLGNEQNDPPMIDFPGLKRITLGSSQQPQP
jgi:hypothetical protein